MASAEVFEGDCFVDDRGILSYLNVAPFEKVKRLYIVENFSNDTIRAFHGHKIEDKFVLVVSGSALVIIAELSDEKLKNPVRYTLSDRKLRLLHIPAGYANGIRTLTPNTKILFFSTTTMQEATSDDFRFDYDYFGEEIWKVKSK